MLPSAPLDRSRIGVCRIAGFVAGVLGAALLSSAPLLAQQGNRDFYEPDTNPNERQLRHNVELYHLEPGIKDMGNARWHVAKGHFEFILNYYPNHPVALNMLSVLCDVRWIDVRCDSASRFALAIERNPTIAQTYVLYGIHLQRRKRLDDAIRAFDKALSINPKLMNAHYNVALAYVDKRQYDLANRHAQISYRLGASLPGLRDKLKSAGHWRPLPDSELQDALGPDVADGTERK